MFLERVTSYSTGQLNGHLVVRLIQLSDVLFTELYFRYESIHYLQGKNVSMMFYFSLPL